MKSKKLNVGIGGMVLTFIGIISSVISYIILYNSTDF